MERKKILLISDHPLVPSGVGTQAKYICEGLLETGKYRMLCFGGAIKHPDYKPQMVAPEKFGEGNWIILPVDGHGSKEQLRQVLYTEKPDAVVMFTDPRFFYWVWEMEDEVRSVCPLIYYHVWDNDPTPTFNRVFYESTDHVIALSRKTYGLLQDMGYERRSYIPHALPHELFKPLPDHQVEEFKQKHFGPHFDKKFFLMWNNRNARRKQTGDVIEAFADFMKQVGRDKVALIMHTQARDPEGQDIHALAERFDIASNLILSEERVQPEVLNSMYNVADCVINIASNEGFGLGTLEAMFSGTPILVHFTGGLQYQIGDWADDETDFSNQDRLTAKAKKLWEQKKGNWWGVPVFPASRSCVGSLQCPYIYDDRTNKKDVVKGLTTLYNMGRTKRKELGLRAREWATKTFSMDEMISSWDSVLEREIARFGSNERKSYRTAEIG